MKEKGRGGGSMTFIIIILFFSYEKFGFCIVRTGVSMIKVKDRTTNPKKRDPNPSKNGDVSRPVQRPV
ncbi:hypothetical protein BDV26DRAFT_259712 [Aspergillus bertholletiae]|uniref:Uncharacterized protein n=1 Tax=Aspergillus bertholletiae TaxID=1226010 RepID=A0A5N7BC91_9EURO|nr:hypothetical protein BDV26DRAFT_259712 [Aspergillus bertholletiae]